MHEIHRAPIKPESVSPVKHPCVESETTEPQGKREKVGAEQRLDRRVAGVERGKGAEDHRCAGKGEGVAVTAKERVDASEAGRRSLHAVVGRCQALAQLIPCRMGHAFCQLPAKHMGHLRILHP